VSIAAGLLVTAVVFFGCGGSSSDPAAIQVGENPVTAATVRHWMSVPVDGRQASQAQVSRFLILSAWIEGEARALGVNVTAAEAETQLDILLRGEHAQATFTGSPLEAELQRRLNGGVARADRVWLIRLDLLESRIAQKRAEALRAITSTQIANYYTQHRSQLITPERRDITWIVRFGDAPLLKAIREVRAGKSLLSLASHLSFDAPTSTGMELASSSQKGFARRIFAAAPHQLIGPVHESVDYYIFEVTKVTPAQQQTLAQAEGSIRSLLQSSTSASTFTSRWTAKTSCSAGYVVAGCRQYRGRPATEIIDWPYS
jgi:hypothetical protein